MSRFTEPAGRSAEILTWLTLAPKVTLSRRHMHACMLSHFSRVWLFTMLWTVARTKLLSPWDSPGKNTGVGCHFLLQGIFPTHGSNPGLLVSCLGRWVLYHLRHLGSTTISKDYLPPRPGYLGGLGSEESRREDGAKTELQIKMEKRKGFFFFLPRCLYFVIIYGAVLHDLCTFLYICYTFLKG